MLAWLSGSNPTVERAFSVLTMMLSDRSLSLHHETMEDLMLLKCNDKNWGCQEREDIIDRALEIFRSKRRIGLTEGQPEVKRRRVEALFEHILTLYYKYFNNISLNFVADQIYFC